MSPPTSLILMRNEGAFICKKNSSLQKKHEYSILQFSRNVQRLLIGHPRHFFRSTGMMLIGSYSLESTGFEVTSLYS